jgi:TM2 domain-containing membrane protein YozV
MKWKILSLVLLIALFVHIIPQYGHTEEHKTGQIIINEGIIRSSKDGMPISQLQDAGLAEIQQFETDQLLVKPKDPFIAGLLSWFMMGVGQIYVQEYWKGSIFIATDLANKVVLILLISHINSRYGPKEDEIVNIDWASFNTGTKVLIISYLVESLGLRVYNVVDAVQSTHRFNERYFSGRENSGFSFKFREDGVSLNYNYWLGE